MEVGDLVAGRYRLVEQVGSGGMGVVFRAVDEHTTQDVALKILEGRSENELERARREAKALAKLSHPGIVSYIDDGETEDGRMFLAMDWVPGITVSDRIDRVGFNLQEAVTLVREVASALETAHSANILHRDIKPTNILLVEGTSRPVLIDFGIARVSGAASSLTRTGHAIGTPGYMSPEQARGLRALGPATDIFALGCLLYTCATGQAAFSGSNIAAVLVKVLMSEPIAIEQLAPETPFALGALLDRMMHKTPAERPSDCAALIREIDALGPMPAGPRRPRKQVSAMTVTNTSQKSANKAHCMIMAAQGSLDDILDPPSSDQTQRLRELISPYEGQLEIAANGALVIHLVGEPKLVTERAAICALELREILPGWSVAISSHQPDIDEAAEASTSLLAATVMSDIFGGDSRGVAVDGEAATMLRESFDLENDGETVRLVRRKG